MPRTRPRSDELIAASVALAAIVFFRLYQPPAEPPLICVFRRLTALPCPLCGMTRALCAMAKGELAAAVSFNALSPLVFALMIAMIAAAALRLAGLEFRAPWMQARFWTWTAAVFAVYGVLRIAERTL